MKTVIFGFKAIILLFLISFTLADAKCIRITEDEGRTVYSCTLATFDDIKEIPDGAEWIRFTVSKLSHLPGKAFSRFIRLRGLLFYNCEIGNIEPNAFDGLQNLQQLVFFGSNIHVLKNSWFREMSNLTHLFLDQNDMVYIDPNVFTYITNLEYLNIEDNNLNCLTQHTLMPLKKLRHARIDKNPWLCNCYSDLTEWMKNQRIDLGVRNATKIGLECMMEDGTKPTDFNLDVAKIQENISAATISDYISITSIGNVLCVGNNISVLSQIPENVRSMKFLNSKFPEIPRFAFFRFGNSLESLDLSNCSIANIHPKAFAGLSKLEQLIIFNNSIGMLGADWFRDLVSLKHLAMDNNGIEHIQSNVFPLLNKLETLSLRKNDIGCFPLRAFASLKHLKHINIANSTWICSCLQDFNKWFQLKNADNKYTVSPTQCTDNKTHMIGRKYASGYRNSSFQQDLGNEERKIINDNAKLLLGESFQQVDSNFDENFDEEDNSARITDEDALHERNKEIANYEYHRFRIQHVKKPQIMRAKYDGFEKTAVPSIPSGYVAVYIQYDQFAQRMVNDTTTVSSLPLFSEGKKSYVSIGGTIWDVMTISVDAELIRFERSTVQKIRGEMFVRYGNLRVLTFLNCGVREIDPQAFKGLINLRELILDDNEISVVRTAWFQYTPIIEKLSLMRNSINRIENGVFQLLPNLIYLGISNNQLNCIGIEGLSEVKKLQSIDARSNPWSCLCQMKLQEWLNERNIQYDEEIFNVKAAWDCIEEYKDSKIAKNNKENNKYSVDNGKFNVDSEIEESAVIQTAMNFQDGEKNQDTKNTNNTDFEITVSGAEQQTPTTVTPDYLNGQCRFHQFNRMTESRWWCKGGNISVLDKIPNNAKRIDIIDSNIGVIPANAFVRFSNLTRLLFYNSSISDVDPMAFATLKKLEWLIFFNNSMTTIKSSWFNDLGNITVLGLGKNLISEIEPEVFEHMPNLERLSIQENNLRCIYTKSLLPLDNLRKVRMQGNPLKWRCRGELIQFFGTRNISYQTSEFYDERHVIDNLLPAD